MQYKELTKTLIQAYKEQIEMLKAENERLETHLDELYEILQDELS